MQPDRDLNGYCPEAVAALIAAERALVLELEADVSDINEIKRLQAARDAALEAAAKSGPRSE